MGDRFDEMAVQWQRSTEPLSRLLRRVDAEAREACAKVVDQRAKNIREAADMLPRHEDIEACVKDRCFVLRAAATAIRASADQPGRLTTSISTSACDASMNSSPPGWRQPGPVNGPNTS